MGGITRGVRGGDGSATVAAPTGSPAAVAVVFGAAGFVMAQTLARVPALRDSVGASQAELGIALVGGGIGSLLAMPHTARLIERFGNRAVTAVALALACIGWGSLVLAPDVWVLLALFVLAGAPVGLWDVSMNIQGYRVEQLRARTVMPYLHAAFSGGAVLGAGLGALAAWQGVGLAQVPVGATVALLVGLGAVRAFVPAEQHEASGAEPDGADGSGRVPGGGRGLTGLEVLIGLVCLAAALAEGAANDWLALLLVDVHGAPEGFGALAYMAFNVTMLVGRLVGAPLTRRWGRDGLARVGGLLAAVGILLVTLVPSLPVAVLGGLLWGLGVSTVFPAAMSAAGEVPGRGNRAIGVVSTIAYGAFLFGAPTIGLLAEAFGLDRALWVVVGFLVLMVAIAGSLRRR